MSAVIIDIKIFNEYLLAHFADIQSGVLSVNLYTVVRAAIMAAETYSREQQRLMSGGVYSLVIKAIPDAIKLLYSKRSIDKALHDDLMSQYYRDKDNSLPNATTEFMILICQMVGDAGKSEDRRCIVQ